MEVWWTKPELIIAMAAAAIALLTAAFTAYQTYLSRRHNRLSVKPHLSVSWEESENGGQFTLRRPLRNQGLGPAVVTAYTVLFEDKELGTGKESGDLRDSMQEKIRQLDAISGFSHGVLAINSAIENNSTKDLLAVKVKISEGFSRNKYRDFFGKIHFIIKYRSMYGDCFLIDTRISTQQDS